MKKYIIITAASFLITFSMYGQTPRLIGPPGGWAQKIQIHPCYPEIVYASTARGGFFISRDYGKTVSPITDFFTNRYGVDELGLPCKEQNYIYVHLRGYSLVSNNEGNSWEVMYNFGHIGYPSRFIFNPKNSDIMYMTRGQISLWRSNDKGQTWYEVKEFETKLKRVGIAATDTSVIYAAADITLYKSTNSGESWEKCFEPSDSLAFDCDQIYVNPLNKNSVLIKDGGALYKTVDGGKTYSKQIIYNMTSFAVNPIDTTIMYVTVGDLFFGGDSGILKSIDGGESWFSITNGIPGYAIATTIQINPQNPEELYAAIGRLGIFKTTNGGENWFRTNLSYADNIYDLYIDPVNFGHLMAAVDGWTVMQTTDDGESWEQSEMDLWNDGIIAISFAFHPDYHEDGFMTTNVGIYETIDGGNSWQLKTDSLFAAKISFNPHNPEILFGAGAFGIFKSTNSGKSWDIVYDEPNSGEFFFDTDNPEIIYTYHYKSIRKSTDGGNSWVNKNNGIKFPQVNFIRSMAMDENNPEILYCGQIASLSNTGSLNVSTNGGDNWFQIDSALKTVDNSVSVVAILLDKNNPGRLYVGLRVYGPSNGALFLTENNGKSWRKVYDGEVNLIKADNSTPRNIYFTTKFGIMKLTDTLTVTTINEVDEIFPSEYKLSQNYPNPFNPSTTIRYSLKEAGLVRIKVYDILGREVTKLVNEIKQEGEHTVDFNADNLPSGVYLYTISSGRFKDTKKMILMR